jgi:hypothetical protein
MFTQIYNFILLFANEQDRFGAGIVV